LERGKVKRREEEGNAGTREERWLSGEEERG